MDLRTLLAVLRRRAVLVLIPLLVVPVVAYALSARETKRYDATAEVLLKPNNPDEGFESVGGATLNQSNPDRYVESQLSLVRSSSLARDVAAELGAEPDVLARNLSAGQKGPSDVIRVTFHDEDPERAALVANAFASGYIESRRLNQVSGLERAAEELQSSLDDLEATVADLTVRLSDPALPATQQLVLQAQSDAASQRFQSLFEQRQDLLVDISLKRGNAELVQSAVPPEAPASPQPRRTAALGGVLGLLLGGAAVLVAERLDDRVRSRRAVEDELGSVVVGELPVDRPSLRNPQHVAVLRDPTGPLSEAIRQLRTSIQFLAIDAPVRRLLVTSSGPGEGKTLVTANLAAAFAKAGEDVIVVSGDLRLPRLEQIFPITPGALGLTDLVATIAQDLAELEQTTNGDGPHHDHTHDGLVNDPVVAASIDELLDQCLVPTAVPGLLLLPRGPQPPDPAEMLSSPVAAALMARLAARADLVIVDTPPVLAVSDALGLSASVDAVVLVASADLTRTGALVRAVRTLHTSPARFLGVVLNRAPLTEGYGYGYGHDVASQPPTHRGESPVTFIRSTRARTRAKAPARPRRS